jgi:hypothetical protein
MLRDGSACMNIKNQNITNRMTITIKSNKRQGAWCVYRAADFDM